MVDEMFLESTKFVAQIAVKECYQFSLYAVSMQSVADDLTEQAVVIETRSVADTEMWSQALSSLTSGKLEQMILAMT